MKKLIYPKPKKFRKELGSIANVDIHRKINCVHYEICLDKAAYLNYKSFTCEDCKMYIEVKESEKDETIKYKKIIKKILKDK